MTSSVVMVARNNWSFSAVCFHEIRINIKSGLRRFALMDEKRDSTLQSPSAASSLSLAASNSRMRSASCCSATRRSALDLSLSTVVSRERMLGIILEVIENPLGLGADIKVVAGERSRNRSEASSATELKFGLDPLVGFNIDFMEDNLLVCSGLNSLTGTSESVAENDRFRLDGPRKEAGEMEDCRSLMIDANGGSLFSSFIESRLPKGCNV